MGDRLRCIRRQVRLGQHDFARELGVKESTYAAWETGRNAVADEVAIAKRVQLRWGVPAWWTLGLEMPKTPTGTDPDGGGGCAIRDSNPEPAD
ncbi:helix-turn-helix domain-containing protein [Dietzia maris]|uniref:helix-turn-helix domain-containing protein n=1 Tax=Dietzia maris TaxID=37915 RepID=UPI00374FC698